MNPLELSSKLLKVLQHNKKNRSLISGSLQIGPFTGIDTSVFITFLTNGVEEVPFTRLLPGTPFSNIRPPPPPPSQHPLRPQCWELCAITSSDLKPQIKAKTLVALFLMFPSRGFSAPGTKRKRTKQSEVY